MGVSMPIRLSGQIETVVFTNEESGFTIARARVAGRRDPVTVVGGLLAPVPGECLEMEGDWAFHPRFGEQFKVERFTTRVPATVDGIRRYLGSGLIKGLGPVMAGRIVDRFGAQTLAVIEQESERLAEVPGIGRKRIAMVAAAWRTQREVRDLMLFLQSHGVGAGYAVRIFKHYGNRAAALVRENPYRLATDIEGIGFLTADRIAEKIGFPRNAPLRLAAGVLYLLQQLADEGHVFFPERELIGRATETLQVEPERVASVLPALAADNRIRIEEPLPAGPGPAEAGARAVFLAGLHRCEAEAARKLRVLIEVPSGRPAVDAEKALAWAERRLAIRLSADQQAAVRGAVTQKVMVITGGPGTGKTTIVSAVLSIFGRLQVQVLLAAPTGRAAKRMSEATGHDARTIHRLLEYHPQKGGFQRGEAHPLDCDVLIVDEASMIDTLLMHHLLNALPAAAGLILVGDVNQLPSVGPGRVLGDIIDSATVPVVRLTEIFRQARCSRIIVNAHRINAGILPELDPAGAEDVAQDFFFIEREDPEEALSAILELVATRVPRRFGFDPLSEIQVLTPMHKGVVGAANLNQRLQAALNPGEGGVARGDRLFRVGDKVMQVRNNYDKELFNGDIGRISAIDPGRRELAVVFEGREVDYEFAELDEIVLAYAVSVHKAQGSEYPAVVFPVLTQHNLLLQRNLLYTAITRARRLAVLVGTRRALAMAVKSRRREHRHTRLRERLHPP
jgi:exodeoxyribonuclease V alpha subunit